MTTEEIVKLVEAARSGDDEALYALIQNDKNRLYAIAFAYLKNHSDALEVIQEATFRAYMRLKKLKEPRYFYTWLIRILIHLCIDEHKRKRRTVPVDRTPEGLTTDMNMDERMLLQMGVERLAPKYRHVILLKYRQDLTFGEIAEILGKPEGTIKTWLHQGLKQLRKQYGREGGGEHVQGGSPF